MSSHGCGAHSVNGGSATPARSTRRPAACSRWSSAARPGSLASWPATASNTTPSSGWVSPPIPTTRREHPRARPTQGPLPSVETLEAALQGFRGSFLQRPPAYSAKKIGGRRSYDLARSQQKLDGAPVIPAPVTVSVAELTLTGYEDGIVRLTVDCSAGFYVRSLAHDLGQSDWAQARISRACGGPEVARRRSIRRGPLPRSRTTRPSAIEGVVPMAGMLPSIPAVMLTERGAIRATHGCSLGPADLVAGPGREESRPASESTTGPWMARARCRRTRCPLPASMPGPRGVPPGAGALRASVRHVRLLSSNGHLLGMAETTAGSGVLHPCVVLM